MKTQNKIIINKILNEVESMDSDIDFDRYLEWLEKYDKSILRKMGERQVEFIIESHPDIWDRIIISEKLEKRNKRITELLNE